jgi:hypothetical protein
MAEGTTGLGSVKPSKVDFNYAITDLSEVSYIEVGNMIRKFASQKAPYHKMVRQLLSLGTAEARQKAMASKFKPDLNYYCLSPEFDYKRAVYLLSYPSKQPMRVHSQDLDTTYDALIREAVELQQKIIQSGDLEVDSDMENTFKTTVKASTFGIGPKGGTGVIRIDTGNPTEFIDSLLVLFKQNEISKIVRGPPAVIRKYLPKFMRKMD